jgi:hypothetical protein
VSDKLDPPDFAKARVVNLTEVLQKRADARAKARAERRKPDFMKPRSLRPFIRRVPHVWLLILDEAGAMPALPLLLAICNQMNVRRKKAVFLTARVWRVARGDTKAKRRPMLAALKRVPNLVCLEYRSRPGSRYWAGQGPLWNAEYPYPDEDSDENDEED